MCLVRMRIVIIWSLRASTFRKRITKFKKTIVEISGLKNSLKLSEVVTVTMTKTMKIINTNTNTNNNTNNNNGNDNN